MNNMKDHVEGLIAYIEQRGSAMDADFCDTFAASELIWARGYIAALYHQKVISKEERKELVAELRETVADLIKEK